MLRTQIITDETKLLAWKMLEILLDGRVFDATKRSGNSLETGLYYLSKNQRNYLRVEYIQTPTTKKDLIFTLRKESNDADEEEGDEEDEEDKSLTNYFTKNKLAFQSISTLEEVKKLTRNKFYSRDLIRRGSGSINLRHYPSSNGLTPSYLGRAIERSLIETYRLIEFELNSFKSVLKN